MNCRLCVAAIAAFFAALLLPVRRLFGEKVFLGTQPMALGVDLARGLDPHTLTAFDSYGPVDGPQTRSVTVYGYDAKGNAISETLEVGTEPVETEQVFAGFSHFPLERFTGELLRGGVVDSVGDYFGVAVLRAAVRRVHTLVVNRRLLALRKFSEAPQDAQGVVQDVEMDGDNVVATVEFLPLVPHATDCCSGIPVGCTCGSREIASEQAHAIPDKALAVMGRVNHYMTDEAALACLRRDGLDAKRLILDFDIIGMSVISASTKVR